MRNLIILLVCSGVLFAQGGDPGGMPAWLGWGTDPAEAATYMNGDTLKVFNIIEFMTELKGTGYAAIDAIRPASAYAYAMSISGDFFTGRAAEKTYLLNLTGTRPVDSTMTGDSRDRLISGAYSNYAINDAASIIHGIGLNIRNRSSGVLGRASGAEFGVKNDGGATLANAYGGTFTIENYGTLTSLMAGLFVDLRNEGAVATAERGVWITNSNNSLATTADAAVYIDDSGANIGWDYGVDMTAATIGTAEIRGQNDETIDNKTDGLWNVVGNITGNNNVTGNDVIAVDSIMGVTGNFTGKIQGLNVTATNNLTTNDLTVADTTALNGVTTTGALVTPLNGGMVPVFDRSVTAAATIGTEQGVIFRVDVADVLSVGGVSNGAGALSSRFVRLEGGLWGNVRTTAINATANLNDWQIVATDTVTITLPALSTCYTVDGFGFLLNIYADRNTVCTINAAGTDSINGGVTVVIDDWEGITLQAMDAVRWGVQ
jgi:hypothetical protein